MAAFTIVIKAGYKTGISLGDPDSCMDPFPYTLRQVDEPLSRTVLIFNLVEVLTMRLVVAPVSMFKRPL